eukprot:2789562-Rhodomonas_salina.1
MERPECGTESRMGLCDVRCLSVFAVLSSRMALCEVRCAVLSERMEVLECGTELAHGGVRYAA